MRRNLSTDLILEQFYILLILRFIIIFLFSKVPDNLVIGKKKNYNGHKLTNVYSPIVPVFASATISIPEPSERWA